ncbi:hypothetical protein EYF80_028518 [Liparis tanakae]|uniref:Uncharacterized protein n=1 Tax=Liparis tanakae TaxID=230148 RepID=A0A4Z2H872_9TELE|nr:hypothetical protein EYF80_028518 [Liparis tanakae]
MHVCVDRNFCALHRTQKCVREDDCLEVTPLRGQPLTFLTSCWLVSSCSPAGLPRSPDTAGGRRETPRASSASSPLHDPAQTCTRHTGHLLLIAPCIQQLHAAVSPASRHIQYAGYTLFITRKLSYLLIFRDA